MSETVDTTNRNKQIVDNLMLEEKNGFAHGETIDFLHETAKEFDTSFHTIRNIYYNEVKNKTAIETDSANNLIRTFLFNEKTIRLIEENGKEYLVCNDIFDNIGLKRTDKTAKEGIPSNHKRLSLVKSSNGYVNTSVITPEGTQILLSHLSQNHYLATIQQNSSDLLKHFTEIGFIDPPLENKQENKESRSIMPETTSTNRGTSTLENEEKNTPSSEASYLKSIKVVSNPSYANGHIVKVRVIHIVPYGVLVETLDEHNIQGLIHIKNARNSYIPDLNMYFEVGDEIEALVTNFDKSTKRLNLSTVEFDIPLKSSHDDDKDIEDTEDFSAYYLEKEVVSNNTVFSEKLGPLKDKITFSSKPAVPIEKRQKEVRTKSNVIMSSHSKNNQSSIQEKEFDKSFSRNSIETTQNIRQILENNLYDISIQCEKEVDKIISILNKKVGALTPSAKQKLSDILRKEDVTLVDFSMSMSSSISNFEPDLGLILLKEIEKNLSDGL